VVGHTPDLTVKGTALGFIPREQPNGLSSVEDKGPLQRSPPPNHLLNLEASSAPAVIALEVVFARGRRSSLGGHLEDARILEANLLVFVRALQLGGAFHTSEVLVFLWLSSRCAWRVGLMPPAPAAPRGPRGGDVDG
jgi:hypothetical protein